MQMSFDYARAAAEQFPRPDGIEEGQVCGDTAAPGEPRCRNDLFFAENAPRTTVYAGPMPAPQPAAETDGRAE